MHDMLLMMKQNQLLKVTVLIVLAVNSICGNALKDDQIDNCAALVAAGKCRTDIRDMNKNCQASCSLWRDKHMQRISFDLANQDVAFYDLVANDATFHPIDLEQFEGYITVLVTVAKTCADSEVSPKMMFDSMERFQKVWPYSLKVLVFPYEHPNVDYSRKDCKSFEEELVKVDRNINVMEMGNLNGHGMNTIIAYLKSAMQQETLDVDTTLYFIIDPDGREVEFHYGKSLQDIKDVLSYLMKGYEL